MAAESFRTSGALRALLLGRGSCAQQLCDGGDGNCLVMPALEGTSRRYIEAKADDDGAITTSTYVS
jgi:hypothetical protein